MSVEFSFRGSDRRLAQYMRMELPSMVTALKRRMDALTIEPQAKIVGEKLSGQVLNQRTGKLAGSIRAIPAELNGTFSNPAWRAAAVSVLGTCFTKQTGDMVYTIAENGWLSQLWLDA